MCLEEFIINEIIQYVIFGVWLLLLSLMLLKSVHTAGYISTLLSVVEWYSAEQQVDHDLFVYFPVD